MTIGWRFQLYILVLTTVSDRSRTWLLFYNINLYICGQSDLPSPSCYRTLDQHCLDANSFCSVATATPADEELLVIPTPNALIGLMKIITLLLQIF
jgi:hypothetical protein